MSLFGESKSYRWQSYFWKLVLTNCTAAGLSTEAEIFFHLLSPLSL